MAARGHVAMELHLILGIPESFLHRPRLVAPAVARAPREAALALPAALFLRTMLYPRHLRSAVARVLQDLVQDAKAQD